TANRNKFGITISRKSTDASIHWSRAQRTLPIKRFLLMPSSSYRRSNRWNRNANRVKRLNNHHDGESTTSLSFGTAAQAFRSWRFRSSHHDRNATAGARARRNSSARWLSTADLG